MNTPQRESFIFYRSFYEAIKELPIKHKSEIYEAIGEYSFNFVEPELTWISKTIWILIKPQLDANNKRFINWCKPKTKQTTSKTEAKQKQSKSKTGTNVKVNVNVKEKEKVNDNVKSKDSKIYFEEKDFVELWNDFIKMRKLIKAPLTERASKMLLKKWEDYTYDTFYKMVEQSISNSWKWIFDLRQENENDKIVKDMKSIAEKQKEERLKRYNITN